MSDKLDALLVGAGILINFNFCRMGYVRYEQLASSSGMQGHGAVTVNDVDGAARSDIDAGFLARIGGVRGGKTNAEARGNERQSACCGVKLHGLVPASSSVQGNERAVAIWYTISFCSYAFCNSA